VPGVRLAARLLLPALSRPSGRPGRRQGDESGEDGRRPEGQPHPVAAAAQGDAVIDLALLYVLGLFTLVVVVVGFVIMAAMLRELQKMTRAVAGLIVQETRKLGGR
jgi:hypothetical protein